MPFQIFSGVFGTFAEAGGSFDFFCSDPYLRNSRTRLQAAAAKPLPATDYVLAPVAASLIADRGRLSILDFGGGPGIQFLSLKQALGTAANLSYHVFDNRAVCALGREHFWNEPALSFHDRMDDLDRAYDLVHFGSMLQYVDDVAALLHAMAAKSPDYILVSDAMTGTKATFVTLADYYGSKHPFRFHSKADLLAIFESAGYSPCLDMPYVPLIRGYRQFYDMTNLPEDCRIDRTRHIMFTSKEKESDNQ